MKNNVTKDIIDGWSPDGQTFILSGMGYRIKKDLTQVCIGPVDQDGELVNAPTTPPALVEPCVSPVTAGETMPQDGETVVTDKIKALAGEGKSTRVIEKELAEIGVNISYRTIARRLQGVLI